MEGKAERSDAKTSCGVVAGVYMATPDCLGTTPRHAAHPQLYDIELQVRAVVAALHRRVDPSTPSVLKRFSRISTSRINGPLEELVHAPICAVFSLLHDGALLPLLQHPHAERYGS